jgi:hypothetical protein
MTQLATPNPIGAEPTRSSTCEAKIEATSRTAQTRRATETLKALLREYAAKREPINVSFRQLVGPIPVTNLSHSIYPYPARLLRQIPRFFLHCEQIVLPGDVVLDPFCGSGTVLVEARAARMTGWGIDRNPFARLLSEVKTTPLDHDKACRAAADVLARAKSLRAGIIPDVVNVDFWFTPSVKQALGRICRAIAEIELSAELRRFLLVALALAAERCSLRDLRIPVPVRRHDWQLVASNQKTAEVWRTFESVAGLVADRLATIPSPEDVASVLKGEDAAQAGEVYRTHLADRLPRPTLILTSPPYGAAQKYIRSCSLALGWTGLATATELATLERGLIGREHLRRDELAALDTPNRSIASEISMLASRDPVRAAIYAHYFRAMKAVIDNLASLLAPGGVLILVAGSNIVAGELIQTHQHLRGLAVARGMSPILELRDRIRGRVLLTKRATTNIPLYFETVHVLRKALR